MSEYNKTWLKVLNVVRGGNTATYNAQIPLGLNQSDIDRFGGVVTWND